MKDHALCLHGHISISLISWSTGAFTLIQSLVLSSMELKAIKRLSAAQVATLSWSPCAIGLAPGFSPLMKNSLKVYKKKI
jgi:hypothetical protein